MPPQRQHQQAQTGKNSAGIIIGIIAAVLVIGVGVFFGVKALIGNKAPEDVIEAPPVVLDSTATPAVKTTPKPMVTPPPKPQEPVVNTLVLRLDSANVTVNGQEAAFGRLGGAPYSQDGFTMLPLRLVYTIIGGTLSYDSDTKYITALFLDTSFKLKAGETGAEVNGVFTALPIAPAVKDGTTYVPARALADVLGAELFWDGESKSVTLKIPSESVIDISLLFPTDFTPSGEPALNDFTWYIDDARRMGVDADQITNMDEIMGDWKMLIWVDPDHIAYYEYTFILCAASISYGDRDGTIFMKVHELLFIEEDGTTQDVSRFDPGTSRGEYLPNGKGLWAGEPGGRYTITDFFTDGIFQYGIGILEVQSGEPCYVALVRP